MKNNNVQGPMDNAGVTSAPQIVQTPKMQKQQTATMADWEKQQTTKFGSKVNKKIGEFG